MSTNYFLVTDLNEEEKVTIARLEYDRMFRLHNDENRPDALTERSMSLGDCLQIAFNEQDIRVYTYRDEEFIEVTEVYIVD